jgi:hypothetical protein
LPTHGGSLRICARHTEDLSEPVTLHVAELRAREVAEGFTNLKKYFSFAEKVKETKRNLLDFLINLKRRKNQLLDTAPQARVTFF